MSQKHRKFSPEFKAKIVLEPLEENAALNEIASKYNVLPKSLQQWKRQLKHLPRYELAGMKDK